MFLPENSTSWDEFRWEKEFRREELRIAGYYRILAACLDLPGEDDLIRRSMAQAEYVPAQFPAGEWLQDQYGGEEDEDGDNENPEARFAAENDWRYKPGAEACRRVEALAAAWNRIACEMEDKYTREILITSCSFGSLVEKVYALSDNSEAVVNMRISIIKRILGNINDLLGCLEHWRNILSAEDAGITDIIKHLHYFREAAVDSLAALRMGI